ncbi:aspartate-semialdehyde dehydrogenase [Frankia sp. AgKG'84/4]|uniref:aspartate-semialdehyde dehydrogenase n=1 Tax=Frankia sp. AgKG'84/4 TaxID=573490 RepID=UPI00200C5DCC|nr:aspartate-semialdehyde dehydrogenase [Frankia sp. AgKG'84/4]MCL9794350.1 aspartate-semialdehyde dehydrogenase [Frankia sp. AgKG'84/4]
MDIAIVGATGVVGREALGLLEAGFLPDLGRVVPVASAGSAGRDLGEEFGLTLKVEPVVALERFDPSTVDVAVFSAGAPISTAWAPRFAAAGALVVDNSSAFRMEDDIPLVVPEVNPHTLRARPPRGIVANPNCSTIQLVRALHPLREIGEIERVIVASYQSASGGGLRGLGELADTTRSLLDGADPARDTPGKFGQPLAFNLIPEIGMRDDEGHTHEERKLRREPRKIMEMPGLRVAATAVRVAVVNGHSEAVHVEFADEVSAADALAALRAAPNLRAYGDDEGYPMPRFVCASPTERRLVHVGRVRSDPDDPRALWLWVVADNLTVGAALNALEIVQLAGEMSWL